MTIDRIIWTPLERDIIARIVWTALCLLLCFSPAAALEVGDIILPMRVASTGREVKVGWRSGFTVTDGVLTLTGSSVAFSAITGAPGDNTALAAALALKAPLASPTFTGTVTIPSGASISGYLTTTAAASSYQPLNANLTSIAALTTTSHGRGLLDDSDATASRLSLGLVIGTNVQAWDADLDDLADGTLSGSKIGTGINATNITSNTLAISHGGTGASTAGAARLALLPSIAGQGGKYLRVNAGATDVEYAAASGGSSISTPRVIYVEANGNDATGVVGDPSKPFATGTAAWNAGQPGSTPFVIRFGVGSFTLDTQGADTGYLAEVIGQGYDMALADSATRLDLRTSPEEVLNQNGNNGGSVDITMLNLALDVRVNGGGARAADSGTYNAGDGGSIILRGHGLVYAESNGGGDAGSSDGTVNEGGKGSVQLTGPLISAGIQCNELVADGADVRVSITAAGSVTLGRCSYSSVLTITNDKGGNASY